MGAVRLFNEYYARLLADARELYKDNGLAEDAAMATLEQFISCREKYDPAKGELYPWLKTIMRNNFISSKRVRKNTDTLYVSPEELKILSDSQANPLDFDEKISRDEEKIVVEAVKTLSPKLREAVMLHYFDDQPLANIARYLKISESSVKNRLFCARKILAHRLADKLGKKKPLAILLALLFGAGALFGAWQAGVALVEAMSNGESKSEVGRAVSMKPPTAENTQTTLTTKQEVKQMKNMKMTMLAATTAASMMMASSATAEAVAYGPQCYSQRELVAMWDCSSGLDNTGWVDWVGGKAKFVWDSTSGMTMSATEGVYFPGVQGVCGYMNATDAEASFFSALGKKNASNSIGGIGTIEIVINPSVWSSYQAAFHTSFNGMAANPQCCFSNNGAGLSTWGFSSGHQQVTISATKLYTIATHASDGVRRGLSFLNGKASSAGSGNGFWITSSESKAAIGNTVNGNYPYKGKIYAIRVYARELSSVEIAEHARIDAVRFGGAEDLPAVARFPMENGYYSNVERDGIQSKACVFTNTAEEIEWTVPAGVSSIELLMVGGGGSAGQPGNASYVASGAGAGGLVYEKTYAVTPGSVYAIKVGAGGAAVTPESYRNGNRGEDTTFYLKDTETGFTAMGGGAGSCGYEYTDAEKGGCGGGRYYNFSGSAGLQSTLGYGMGCAGGSVASGKHSQSAGGGGGATSAGSDPGGQQGSMVGIGIGGNGFVSDIAGVSTEYAHGGDSSLVASESTVKTPGVDGFDGRGNGGTPSSGSYAPGSGKGGDGVVIVRYAKVGRQLTVSPNIGYLVSLDGEEYADAISTSVPFGDKVTIFAKKSDSGEATFEWSGSLPAGTIISADTKAISFMMPEDDLAVSVIGSAANSRTLTIVVDPAEGGVVDGDSSETYPDGTIVTHTATPSEHYNFVAWEGDGEIVGNKITVTMDDDKTITAKFAQKPRFSLSLAESPYGSISATPAAETYEQGEKVTLTAEPNEGVRFMRWGGDAVGTSLSIQITMDGDKTVSAIFGYELTIIPSECGVIEGATSGEVFEIGESVNLTAIPNEGCEFIAWGGDASGSTPTTTVKMDGTRTAMAYFKDANGRVYTEWGYSNVVKVAGVKRCVLAFTQVGKQHTFTLPSNVKELDYLIVGGGGGGGGYMGGGGGAGGLIAANGVAIAKGTTLSVLVGAGGVGGVGGVDVAGNGGKGSISTLSYGGTSLSADGGGAGGGGWKAGGNGGSGGGCGCYTQGLGGSATQGNKGGDSLDKHFAYGAGGGGADGEGGDNSGSTPGVGGLGFESFITGESAFYAAGGGGGAYKGNGAAGGSGIGGNANGGDGVDGTGSGGGGAGEYGTGGKGGSGVVIVSYPIAASGLMLMIY